MVSDDRKLNAGRDVEHGNVEKPEEFAKLNKSKNQKKRKRSKYSPCYSRDTVQYNIGVKDDMGKHIDISSDLGRREE